MADLELSVDVRGATQAQQGLQNVGRAGVGAAGGLTRAKRATTGLSSSWDGLARKLTGATVLRNAAASAVLLGSGASGAADKIAALGGALASVPGPIGALAAAVGLGAAAWSAWEKATGQSAARAAEAAREMKNLETAVQGANDALAGRVSGAVMGLGDDARRAFAAGGSAADRDALLRLTPGDPRTALRGAAALAEADLDSGGRERVLGALESFRRTGGSITDDAIQRAIAAVRQEQAAFSPLDPDAARRREAARAVYEERGGGIFGPQAPRAAREETDFERRVSLVAQVGGEGDDAASIARVQRRLERAFSREGRVMEAGMSMAERPAFEQSQQTIEAASRGAFVASEAVDALRGSSNDAAAELDDLTRSARDASRALARFEQQQTPRRGAGGGWSLRAPWRQGSPN